MARVCHVISGYFRTDARVFVRQCKSLHKHGFDVSILTNDGMPDEVIDGIAVHACRVSWPRWKTLLFARWQFLAKAIEIDADIYQIHSPELLGTGLALKRRGKRVVYDAHEDMPRHILEKEWLPSPFRKLTAALFQLYMLYALRRYDDVVSPHSHVVADLQKRIGAGLLIANFPIFRPGVDITLEQYICRSQILIYSGTVYPYSNQEEIMSALGSFPDAEYHIAGYIDPDHSARLQSGPNGKQVSLLGRLNRADLFAFYQSALIGLVIYDYKLNLGWKLGSYGTNKVFEYMEAGIPFICTDYILWEDIANRYDCAICVPPGDVDAIKNAIAYLLENKERAYAMGQNGRRAISEEFNWATEEQKYVSLFQRLVKC